MRLVWVIALSACSSSGPAFLGVDLRTDFLAGIEVAEVDVTIRGGGTALQGAGGGSQSNGNARGGGGGGGGWFGGGGGRSETTLGFGGGGGSGHTAAAVTSPRLLSGAGIVSGNADDAERQGAGDSGVAGAVVLRCL